MSQYIVSARKYRPMTFASVVGQSALTTTLRNAVRTGRLAHAYLFCGPRGVGKTTCARIFAKAINCESPTADGEACNECESCRAFNEGRSMNIFELDAASNNGVDQIKSLMDQTRIPPQYGRYKVFIIDEVHMLSQQAFNAFLKTLEEPPSHVVFVLATTEKHKILPTIISRCQIYDFDRMSVADTIAHLKRVAAKEGIECEEEALTVIAQKADGGMRDALSIFDQAVSFCQGPLTYAKVVEDLGMLAVDNYFTLVDLALENKVAETMVLVDQILGRGFDGGQLVLGLGRHIRNTLMAKDEKTLPLIEVSQQLRERYHEQAVRMPLRYAYKALKLISDCDNNYKQSGCKRLLVELTLIEAAQITAPDDALGAGRWPRTLKSLFRTILRQKKATQSAQQVAPAPSEAQSASAAVQTAAPEVPAEEAAPAPKPTPLPSLGMKLKTKEGPLGFSWHNLRQAAQKKKINIVPGMLAPGDPNAKRGDESEPFTQQDVEYQWMSMCNRMPQRLSGIASRMKNMNPQVVSPTEIAVTVDNALQRDQLESIRGSIQSTLRLYLHNAGIQFGVRLAEQKEAVKILSRREQFELMSSQNPAVQRLRDLLDLQLA